MIPSAHLDDLRIDRHLVGELDDAARDQVTLHLDACSRCKARVQVFAQLRDSFPTDYPFSAVVSRRHQRTTAVVASRSRAWFAWRRSWMMGSIAAAATVVALVFALGGRIRGDQPNPVGTRLKGGDLAVAWYVERSGALIQLWPGQPLWTGDRLQIAVSARTAGFVSVISIDGADQSNVYFPSDPGASYSLAAGLEHRLPSATDLDDVIGQERLFVVFCAEPFVPAELAALFRSQPSDAVRLEGCSITEHDFRKITKPSRAP